MMMRGGPRPPKDSGETPDVPVNWRRMFAYLRPYWRLMLLAFLALVVSSGLSLVFPAVIQRVVDSVLVAHDMQLLDQITLILLIVFVIRSLSSLVETYFVNYVGEKVVVDMRLELYSHLQMLSLGFYSKRRVGELVSRLSSDVTMIRSGLTNNVNTLLQQILIVIGSVIVMLALNWRLTLFVLVLAPLIGGLGAVFGRIMRRSSTAVQDELAGALTVASEVLQSIREVKSFGREPYEEERFGGAVGRAFQISLSILRLRSILGHAGRLHRLRRHGGDPMVRRARGARRTADRRRTDRLPDLRREHRRKPRLAADAVHVVRAGVRRDQARVRNPRHPAGNHRRAPDAQTFGRVEGGSRRKRVVQLRRATGSPARHQPDIAPGEMWRWSSERRRQRARSST
ncbi:MAG: ABC transporter transmembrane domain-containing protein [Anaerolineae bacterium]